MIQIQHYHIIPLRAKRIGEIIEIRHKKISLTRILSTLGCLSKEGVCSELRTILQFCGLNSPFKIKFLMILTKKISTLANFQLSPSLYRWPHWRLKTCPNSHHLQGGLEICRINFTSTIKTIKLAQ